MSAARVDARDLAQMLNQRIEALCRALLPGGVKDGFYWRCGSLGGEAGDSLGVHLGGRRQGMWVDFNGHTFGAKDGLAGDALDLVARVKFGGNRGDAIRWAKDWLGIERADPETLQEVRREREQRSEEARDNAERRHQAALRLFLEAQPQLAGTAAEIYLRDTRGIDFAVLGRQPRSLRFHPGITHRETCARTPDGQIVWRTGRKCPCLVAAITGPDNKIHAVHLTFLERLADGSVVKLRDVKDAKLTLGRYAGGAIRLWRGASKRPHSDPAAGEWVMTGEGIEDVATGVMAVPEMRAFVAVSLANMGSLWLPEAIEGVVILAQNDPATNERGEPHPARVALARGIAHFKAIGKRVRLVRPPVFVKDINEYRQKLAQSELA